MLGNFKCKENIKAYAYPTLKIVLCSALVVLIINRDRIFRIDSPFLSSLITIICVGVTITAILCIYLSIAEMIMLHERREKNNIELQSAMAYSKDYSVDDIISLLITNDIIEITIVSNNQIVSVGASSDSRPGSSLFFDKGYYVNDTEYIKIDDLKKEINNISKNGKVCVIAIDGVPPDSCHG